jgi:hypothetical protein
MRSDTKTGLFDRTAGRIAWIIFSGALGVVRLSLRLRYLLKLPQRPTRHSAPVSFGALKENESLDYPQVQTVKS